MAYLHETFCLYCKTVTNHIDGKCACCYERQEQQRLMVWDSYSTERKIEELRKRVEQLENGPLRYS